MGYELHVVKNKNGSWIDDENKFTEREWKDFQEANTFPEWLYFSSGNISVKNPDEAQIIALVKIAKENGWRVQGDDDETYFEDGSSILPEVEKPGIFEPVRKFFAEQKAKELFAKLRKIQKFLLRLATKSKPNGKRVA